jgi:hypothetical protein
MALTPSQSQKRGLTAILDNNWSEVSFRLEKLTVKGESTIQA